MLKLDYVLCTMLATGVGSLGSKLVRVVLDLGKCTCDVFYELGLRSVEELGSLLITHAVKMLNPLTHKPWAWQDTRRTRP